MSICRLDDALEILLRVIPAAQHRVEDIDESNALTDHRFGVWKAWRLIGETFSEQCESVCLPQWVGARRV
jgi:hypothetical protein